MSKILIVHAHPETKSLTSALKDHAVEVLSEAGHEVQVSDLYGIGWNAVAGWPDFPEADRSERLVYGLASGQAYASGQQSADVAAEQRKLLWADAVVFSFPMWWFGMPAILKGWVERVFAYGLAYGVGEHGGERWGDRYGEGMLSGRRAMLIVTVGGQEAHYSARGVNGALDDVLWPIQHGMLFYPGMEVLAPFATFQTHRLTEAGWPQLAGALRERLDGLFTDEPIPFRTQNGGHYDTNQVLKPGLGAGTTGSRIHLFQPGEPPESAGPAARRTAGQSQAT